MPRRRRIIIPGVPHHVVQRAAHGRRILESDECKAVFIELLGQWAKRTGVLVGGFVLMNNHCHLCAIPPDGDSLSLMIGRATAALSSWINVGNGDVGPNWQGAFYASAMDEQHTVAALRYIERNPVAAGLAVNATDWRWSSAGWHCGNTRKPGILSVDLRPAGCTPAQWHATLRDPGPEDVRRRIHAASSTGDVLADEGWIARMESTLGRPLRRRPRWRPRESGP
jgi:putative transposase